MDVKSRNGEKFEIFSNFLAHPVETPWPILTVLNQNVHTSVPYILDHIWHRWEFFEYLTPPPPAPQGPMGTTGGGGTPADIVPT